MKSATSCTLFSDVQCSSVNVTSKSLATNFANATRSTEETPAARRLIFRILWHVYLLPIDFEVVGNERSEAISGWGHVWNPFKKL